VLENLQKVRCEYFFIVVVASVIDCLRDCSFVFFSLLCQKVRTKYVQSSKEADSCEATHSKGKGDVNMKPAALAKVCCQKKAMKKKEEKKPPSMNPLLF
jgi:hypothetical protein